MEDETLLKLGETVAETEQLKEELEEVKQEAAITFQKLEWKEEDIRNLYHRLEAFETRLEVLEAGDTDEDEEEAKQETPLDVAAAPIIKEGKAPEAGTVIEAVGTDADKTRDKILQVIGII